MLQTLPGTSLVTILDPRAHLAPLANYSDSEKILKCGISEILPSESTMSTLDFKHHGPADRESVGEGPQASTSQAFLAPCDSLPSEKTLGSMGNFTAVKISPIEKVPLDPFLKPVGIPPPATLREARLSPWWPQYQIAAGVEYDGHIKNGTWELVEKSSIPRGKNILRGKWVFDDKRDEKGKILKFKARYVAMGFTQKKGIDYTETFAGVVIGKSFRTMLIILNECPTFEMEHWDIKMAFTQAPIEEEIFMYQPELFENDSENFVCRLKKSLYGLKQAGKNWSDMLREMFREVGFFTFFSDPCVYFLQKGKAWCLCSTHVDDIFCLFNEEGKFLRNLLYEKISKKVDIENLGPVSWALKTAVLRDRKEGIIKISQEAFISEFLEKHEVRVPQKLQLVPTHDGQFLPKNFSESDQKIDETLKKRFQSIIGGLWWLTSISRPDIYYAVHRCSKMINSPNKILEKCLQKILLYLACTKSVGIIYQRKPLAPTLSGFVDAAFGSEDENFLSRIGYFYLFKGNLVSWVSENPTRIMTSSTEAECRGLVHFSKENLWHRQFHAELKLYPISAPTTVYEDNSSAITMSSDMGLPHKRSKHFGIEFAFFKQSVNLKEIQPVFVSTNDQPADMLTKTLLSSKFVKFREMVMGGEYLQNFFESK